MREEAPGTQCRGVDSAPKYLLNERYKDFVYNMIWTFDIKGDHHSVNLRSEDSSYYKFTQCQNCQRSMGVSGVTLLSLPLSNQRSEIHSATWEEAWIEFLSFSERC
jgi:hypothetical protein